MVTGISVVVWTLIWWCLAAQSLFAHSSGSEPDLVDAHWRLVSVGGRPAVSLSLAYSLLLGFGGASLLLG